VDEADQGRTGLTMDPGSVPLSVLDLAPVPDGGNIGDALRATIDWPGTPSGHSAGPVTA
jgi:hypothetical protein